MTKKPKKLITPSEIETAIKAFRSVFKSANTFSNPFQQKIERKAILYNQLYGLDEKHYNSLGESVIGTEDKSRAYITITESYANDSFSRNYHWEIDLCSYPYKALEDLNTDWCPIMENAIYSTSGEWGIIFSKYGHAIFGGSEKMFKLIEQFVPKINNEVNIFLSEIENEMKLSTKTQSYFRKWLPNLLSEIYGPNEAKQMLKHSGLQVLISDL